MSVETDLVAVLQTVCVTTYPDFAPTLAQAPWVTWQHIGGRPLRYLDGSAADLRNSVVQVNAWHTSRGAALALIRQIEDALCAPSAPFVARPEGEPVSHAEPELLLYGCQQDFSIHGPR